MKNKLYKLFHWEYWPLLMFYIPNIPYAFFHGVLARNLVFYTAVNPGILNSGIGSESKFKTLNLLPKKYLPKTVFHQQSNTIENTIKAISKEQITYPLIAKPDVGFRGLLVKKISSEKELIAYLEKYPIDIIIQEFLTHSNECGIFYYRIPNEKNGTVTSITLKEFLHIKGDGLQTIESLILSDKRAKLYLELLKENNEIDLELIPNKDEVIKLSAIGNHSKGTQFISGNHLINTKINDALNQLSHQVDGWFYGRLDVKYNTLQDLENGNFKVLELNGILAEPTHIYDASKNTYFKALKTIRTHWKQLYKIARYNNTHNNIAYRKTLPFLKEMFALKAYSNRVKKLAKLS